MNSHYQSIWTGLSSAGTGPKSNSTLSTSSNSVPCTVLNRHYLLLTKKEKISSRHIERSSRSDRAEDLHDVTVTQLVPALVYIVQPSFTGDAYIHTFMLVF